MIRIVDDLLDVTRVRTGKLTLRPEPVSLASIVEKSLESTPPADRGEADTRLTRAPPSEPR